MNIRHNGKDPRGSWTDEERRKVYNGRCLPVSLIFAYLHLFLFLYVTALAIRAFLDSTPSQLTYRGLFHLASTLLLGGSWLCSGAHICLCYIKMGSPSSLIGIRLNMRKMILIISIRSRNRQQRRCRRLRPENYMLIHHIIQMQFRNRKPS